MNRFPSLNALRAFEATARLGSLLAAAQELHVTPSAVSHQIKRLEEQLGSPLLLRTPRKVTLSDAGADYYRDLSVAFAQIALATERLQRRRDQDAVTVTVAPAIALKWLVPRLADFYQRHPGIDVHLNTTGKVQDLRRSDDDLGIRWGTGQWPGVQAERLLQETVQPVCSPALLRGRKRLATPRRVCDFKLIQMSLSRDDWRTWCRLHGFELPPTQEMLRLSDPLPALQAAIDGLGIALGPSVMVHDDIAAGRLVAPFAASLALREAYYLVWSRPLERNPAAVRFRDWLREITATYLATRPPAALTMTAPVER